MRVRVRRAGNVITAVGLLALAGACSKNDATPPVATVTFAANKTQVPLGSPIDLTYTFAVSPNAKITGDYHVFVHLVNDEGQPVWFDDHDPIVPTSQWKPGQTVTYTRTEFLPVFPYVGKATMEIGLYKGDERLPLAGPDPTDKGKPARAYKVATLELLPATENVFIITKSGWHQAEFAPNNPSREWQWTEKSAVLDFKNPKKDVTFFIESDGRPDLFPTPQQVTHSSNNQVVTTFAVDNASPHPAADPPFPPPSSATGDMVELRHRRRQDLRPGQTDPPGARTTGSSGFASTIHSSTPRSRSRPASRTDARYPDPPPPVDRSRPHRRRAAPRPAGTSRRRARAVYVWERHVGRGLQNRWRHGRHDPSGWGRASPAERAPLPRCSRTKSFIRSPAPSPSRPC